MDIKEHIRYWLDTADNDLKAAESMFRTKRYDWCLFLGHLVLEKILKALYVCTNENISPPKIHNLIKLSDMAKLILTDEERIFLGEVNNFHLEV